MRRFFFTGFLFPNIGRGVSVECVDPFSCSCAKLEVVFAKEY